ncbi:MAG: ABC transporter permease, partial [Marivirga sp.]|nr:ABC transporter permease [Marivirga sp.]
MKTKKSFPPYFFLRFFRWYCHPRLADHIEGDLIEVYQQRLKKTGKRKADIRFVIDVILLFRPRIIRPIEGFEDVNTYGMYKNYLKIGWRNLLKHKGYSFINIGGLTAGMSAAIIIGLWIFDEMTFNKYHTNYDTIGRVMRNITVNGEILTRPYLPNNLGDELKTKYGNNFRQVVMAYPVEEYFLTYGETKLPIRGEFMDGNGAELFTLPMMKGIRSGLLDPHSIFLSESTAKIVFGEEEPMGKLLKINNSMDVRVTGVYK